MYINDNLTAVFPVASNILLGIELNGLGTSTLIWIDVSAVMEESSPNTSFLSEEIGILLGCCSVFCVVD